MKLKKFLEISLNVFLITSCSSRDIANVKKEVVPMRTVKHINKENKKTNLQKQHITPQKDDNTLNSPIKSFQPQPQTKKYRKPKNRDKIGKLRKKIDHMEKNIGNFEKRMKKL